MKRLFFKLIVLILSANITFVYGEDFVNLKIDNVNKLNIPDVNKTFFTTMNQYGEYEHKDLDENCFVADEEVFETKSGQAFSKFIDERVINNKFVNQVEQLKK